jgi:hypothetical protein
MNKLPTSIWGKLATDLTEFERKKYFSGKGKKNLLMGGRCTNGSSTEPETEPAKETHPEF